MAYKPKTRVAVRHRAGTQELFSVRELPDGQLQIFLKWMNNYEDLQLGDISILEEKISVHAETSNGCSTIKRKNILVDGRHISHVSIVSGPRSELLWFMYARRVAQFSDKYQLKAHQKDKVIILGDYNQEQSSLIYALVVRSINMSCDMAYHGYNQSHIHFKNVIISIYTTFINLPSVPGTDYMSIATGPEQDSPAPKKLSKTVRPATEPQIAFLLRKAGDLLSYRLLRRYLDSLDDSQPTFRSQLNFYGRMITRMPLKNLEKVPNQSTLFSTRIVAGNDDLKRVIVCFQGESIGEQFSD